MLDLEIMQTSPVFFWLICFMSVTALAISKSGFGGALGSISTPILLFVMPPKMALGVLLPIFLITDVWVVYIWRKHVHWRFVFIMCGFGIAGQLAGWLLFDYFSNSVLRGLIGTIGLLTALNYLRLRIWPRAELAEDVANGGWINTDDLNGLDDGIHFPRENYPVLGKRFADKAIEMIDKQ